MSNCLTAPKMTANCLFSFPNSELELHQHLTFSVLMCIIGHKRENRAREEHWGVLASNTAAVRTGQNSYHLSSTIAISTLRAENVD